MSLVLGAALLGEIFARLYGVNQLLRQEENVISPKAALPTQRCSWPFLIQHLVRHERSEFHRRFAQCGSDYKPLLSESPKLLEQFGLIDVSQTQLEETTSCG